MNELAPSPRVCGFGQTARLSGDKLMRLTYLDEGGISQHEPMAVVAGVIVHGDRQLVPVENHLQYLLAKHIPEQDRTGFVFHAKDIWSNKKFFKDKEKWPWDRRAPILEDLSLIPKMFDLPVAFGVSEKSFVSEQIGGVPYKTLDAVSHACAFSSCTQRVERYFRDHFRDEFTIVIAEDRQEVRRFMKTVQAMLQGRKGGIPDDIVKTFSELPYRHIRDTLHWAGKDESPILQVADMCAFFIRGGAAKNARAQPFVANLTSQLLPLA